MSEYSASLRVSQLPEISSNERINNIFRADTCSQVFTYQKLRKYRILGLLAEAYGVRLPADYDGEILERMQLMDVPEGEYIVIEHGPFDFETESQSVEAKLDILEAIGNFYMDI